MNLFTERKPIHPPLDAVARLRQLTAAGIDESEARRIVGREVDHPAATNKPQRRVQVAPATARVAKLNSIIDDPAITARLGVPALPTPDSPVITNRFRRQAPKPAVRPKFDPVSHFALIEVSHVGQMQKPSGPVTVRMGFTAWPDTHENARYNGAIHISGLAASTVNLSFDALAALVALAPQIEKYLETHSEQIAAAEVVAQAARRARRDAK